MGGVLLSLVLSVLLWPKSASEQAMRYAFFATLVLLLYLPNSTGPHPVLLEQSEPILTWHMSTTL